MAITIKYTQIIDAVITYYNNGARLFEDYHGNIDDIAEHACEVLIKHNFQMAWIKDRDDEQIMTVTRN